MTLRAKHRWPGFPGLRKLVAQWRDPVILLPYIGYGTPEKLKLCGRVLQDEGFRSAKRSDPRWRNLAAFLKRLETDEIPGARVRATYRDRSVETISDSEGYFNVEFETSGLPPGWHEIQIELPHLDAAATGMVLVPPPDAEFGVISDLDDTVIQSGVTRRFRMMVKLALSNSRTRKPFRGAAAFYRALHRDHNPFFYVSKSPHNLYAPLVEFLQHQRLPAGPLLLRDYGLRMEKDHKARVIEDILTTYPSLRFILIGDSGEQDPEVYAAILNRFPERVRVIYIRSVDRSPKRLKAIEMLVEKVASTGCQLVLAADSEFAAAHAAAEGLIPTAELAGVRVDKTADKAGRSSRKK